MRFAYCALRAKRYGLSARTEAGKDSFGRASHFVTRDSALESRRAQSLYCAASRPIRKPVGLWEAARQMAQCASLIAPYGLSLTAMPNYRRAFVPGGCWFFTVNLLDRRSKLLIDNIDALREATRWTLQRYPFH